MDVSEMMYLAQQIQEYVEAHITEKITLKEIAEVVNYSPWYTAKFFKKATGKAPYDYIKSVRLSKAALVLRDEPKKVIDVALDFVFDSQEGFTRAFSKEFGISPARYRKDTPPIRLYRPSKFYETYQGLTNLDAERKEQKMDTRTIFCQVIERPERKCLLKRAKEANEYFAYCNEVGCDVWDILSSVKEALYEPIGMWLPKKLRPEGTSEYVQGVELPMNYNKEVPEGFELVVFPPCTMMVFQGEPYDDAYFGDAIGAVWEHINKFNPEVYGYEWAAEDAPRFQLAPMGYRGYIEARPIRKLS